MKDPDDGKDQSKTENEQSMRPTMEEMMMPENMEPFFKLANPIHMQEFDWAITFSKYDFPWYEIKFDRFTPKQCYKMYT